MDSTKKEVAKQYGLYLSRQPNGFPRRSIVGRIRDEGAGAAIRSHSDHLPIGVEGCPVHLVHVHRAFRNDMTEEEHNVFFLEFVAKGSPKKKAEALGMSRATFYRILEVAMSKIP